MDIPVVPHDDRAGTADDPGNARDSVSELEFHQFRNRVLRLLRQFGSVGPMGEAPLDNLGVADNWAVECEDPDFYVVDDMWNEKQMFASVQTAPELLSRDVLYATAWSLREVPGWAVSYALFRSGASLGGVLVLHDRVIVAGHPFADCKTISDVAAACEGLVC